MRRPQSASSSSVRTSRRGYAVSDAELLDPAVMLEADLACAASGATEDTSDHHETAGGDQSGEGAGRLDDDLAAGFDEDAARTAPMTVRTAPAHTWTLPCWAP